MPVMIRYIPVSEMLKCRKGVYLRINEIWSLSSRRSLSWPRGMAPGGVWLGSWAPQWGLHPSHPWLPPQRKTVADQEGGPLLPARRLQIDHQGRNKKNLVLLFYMLKEMMPSQQKTQGTIITH